MDADVSGGADTACGQGFKDDGRVQPRKTRSSNIRLNIDPAEPQLGRLSHGLYWKDFLGNRKKMYVLTDFDDVELNLHPLDIT